MRVFLKRTRRLLGILLVITIANFSIQYFFPNEYERFFEPVPNKVAQPAPLEPNEFNVEVTLMNLGIPTGTVDGVWDQRSKQGFCIWRELTGRDVNRDVPDAQEQIAIVETQQLTLDRDFIVGMNINKACQSAVWVKDATMRNIEIFYVSTGTEPGGTDVGTWSITWRVNRWYESVQIPDGWMYKPMFFAYKGQALHGSEQDSFVHWYPASHGCVRMLHKDIEKLWAAGFNVGDRVRVYGKWQG